MKKLKLFHDKKGNTLTVWFDDPLKEHVSEEIGDDVILMKDKKGYVIGVEKLNYIISKNYRAAKIPFEYISA